MMHPVSQSISNGTHDVRISCVCTVPFREKLLIIVPTTYDIICSQNKTDDKHRGNQILRAKMIASVPEYLVLHRLRSDTGQRKAISLLIKQVLNDMKTEYGSRFIRYDKDKKSWIEIDDGKAHQKVSHSLRTFVKRSNSKVQARTEIKESAIQGSIRISGSDFIYDV
jgi:hypothetical protein